MSKDIAPLGGGLTGETSETLPVNFVAGGMGSGSRRAVVKVEIDAATYRALGPIAARKGKATTPYINQVLADIVGRKELGEITGPA